jgi:hypothetical protein
MAVIALRGQGRLLLRGKGGGAAEEEGEGEESNETGGTIGTRGTGGTRGTDGKGPHYFCRIKTLMGEPVSVQFSRILFSRKRR